MRLFVVLKAWKTSASACTPGEGERRRKFISATTHRAQETDEEDKGPEKQEPPKLFCTLSARTFLVRNSSLSIVELRKTGVTRTSVRWLRVQGVGWGALNQRDERKWRKWKTSRKKRGEGKNPHESSLLGGHDQEQKDVNQNADVEKESSCHDSSDGRAWCSSTESPASTSTTQRA